MELQESKKHLAGVLLSPHDGGRMDDSLGTLQASDGYTIPPRTALTDTRTAIAVVALVADNMEHRVK